MRGPQEINLRRRISYKTYAQGVLDHSHKYVGVFGTTLANTMLYHTMPMMLLSSFLDPCSQN